MNHPEDSREMMTAVELQTVIWLMKNDFFPTSILLFCDARFFSFTSEHEMISPFRLDGLSSLPFFLAENVFHQISV